MKHIFSLIKINLILNVVESFILTVFWVIGFLFLAGMFVAFYFSMKAYLSYFE